MRHLIAQYLDSPYNPHYQPNEVLDAVDNIHQQQAHPVIDEDLCQQLNVNDLVLK